MRDNIYTFQKFCDVIVSYQPAKWVSLQVSAPARASTSRQSPPAVLKSFWAQFYLTLLFYPLKHGVYQAILSRENREFEAGRFFRESTNSDVEYSCVYDKMTSFLVIVTFPVTLSVESLLLWHDIPNMLYSTLLCSRVLYMCAFSTVIVDPMYHEKTSKEVRSRLKVMTAHLQFQSWSDDSDVWDRPPSTKWENSWAEELFR